MSNPFPPPLSPSTAAIMPEVYEIRSGAHSKKRGRSPEREASDGERTSRDKRFASRASTQGEQLAGELGLTRLKARGVENAAPRTGRTTERSAARSKLRTRRAARHTAPREAPRPPPAPPPPASQSYLAPVPVEPGPATIGKTVTALPLLPVSVLPRVLPVALMSPFPVRERFSTFSEVVKLTSA